MNEFSVSNQENTFVVRIWHDRSETGRSWYGRVENIHTVQHISFQDWERLVDFIRSVCAIDDQSHDVAVEVSQDDT